MRRSVSVLSLLWGGYILSRIQPNSDMKMYVFKTQAWNTCIYRIVTWQCRQPDVHGVVLFVPLFYRMSVSASSITQRPLQEQHSMQALLVSATGWAHPQETRPQQQRQTHNTPYSHLLKVPPALLLSSEREKHLACLCVCCNTDI